MMNLIGAYLHVHVHVQYVFTYTYTCGEIHMEPVYSGHAGGRLL